MLAARSTGALLILLLLAGCNRGAQQAADGVSQQEADTPVEAFFRFGPVEMGRSRESVRRALGAADSTAASVVANRHDASVNDSVFTLHYGGLAVEIYRASYDGKELLTSLRITDNRFLRPESPLRIGMSRDDILLVLGDAEREEDGDLFYTCMSCGIAGYDALELRLEQGSLREILLQYWID